MPERKNFFLRFPLNFIPLLKVSILNVCKPMQVKGEGLTSAQVLASRERYGANRLTPPKKESVWLLYLQKFGDPMILILLVALACSFGISIYGYVAQGEEASTFIEPVGILVAVLLSTGIAFYFERKAAREFSLLNQVNDQTHYKVVRDGVVTEAVKEELVVGDLVLLDTGEEVPADGVLVESVGLQVNESSLTGEPLAAKTTNPADFDAEATYPSNRLYRGSVITDGHCSLEVTEVGDFTEAGRVYRGSQMESSIDTPLNQQLARLARKIAVAGYFLAGALIIGRVCIFVYSHPEGFAWLELGEFLLNTIMLAVTLLVVAVPEGLPMSISLSLALSMRSMMKTNNLVRRMHACETMGATTVICTDKTGTLTQNQMRVSAIIDGCGAAVGIHTPLGERVAHSIASNSTAHIEEKEGAPVVLGNPTEGALLLWLREQGLSYLTLRQAATEVEQLTFSTERKYMGTVVEDPATHARYLYVKGAPEILAPMCGKVLLPSGEEAAMDTLWPALQGQLAEYQQKGMRTLALAYLSLPQDAHPFAEGRIAADSLTFLALVAISDPVRPDVPAAIAECLNAGVAVKIVTGDTLLTTREIARQIGLWDDTCGDEAAMSGAEFEVTPDAELIPRLQKLRIMYRARPMDKARLIGLLQEQGEVVAATGDGTNDAPALKTAHVGLSMGDGTAMAKEASDMTILDNSFVSIGKGILWGRSLYQNIQRFILAQLTINVAACLVVLLGAFVGERSPLTITQMLWINLIMDTFAALAFAMLPPDPRVMLRKPRRTTDFIITPAMSRMIWGVGMFFVVVLLGLLLIFRRDEVTQLSPALVLESLSDSSHGSHAISTYELSLFFSLFVFMQLWNFLNAKAYGSGRLALSDFSRARRFFWVVGCIALGQWLIMNFGGELFGIVPLSWRDQLQVVLYTSLVFWVGEFVRLWIHRGARRPAEAKS